MPLLILLAVLQSTLFTRLNMGGVVPNLVLVAVAAWNLLRGTREGFVWAFCGGLALDLLSAGPLGLSSIALLIVCALAGLTEGHVQSQSLVLALATVALGTLVFELTVLLGIVLSGHAPGSLGETLRLLVTSVLLNTFTMVLVHPLLRRLYRAAERSEVRLGA